MTSTPDLIRALAGNLSPVRRLRPPVLRAALWLLLAAAVLVFLAISQGIRSDLMSRLQDTAFASMIAGAVLTAVTAAIAAFMLSLPDRSKWWLALPLPPLAFWFSNIGYQCLTRWIVLDPSGMTAGETARCFATVVLTSLPLSLALFLMLKHSVSLRPMVVAVAGSLSVASLSAVALFLFHVLDASVLVIMWNMGTAVVIVGLSSLLAGRYARRRRFSNIA